MFCEKIYKIIVVQKIGHKIFEFFLYKFIEMINPRKMYTFIEKSHKFRS